MQKKVDFKEKSAIIVCHWGKKGKMRSKKTVKSKRKSANVFNSLIPYLALIIASISLFTSFNNRQMNVRQTGTSNNYHQVVRTPDISQEELIRLCKELRNRTGEGLLSCKAALLNNNLNLEAAQNWLRDKGLAKV